MATNAMYQLSEVINDKLTDISSEIYYFKCDNRVRSYQCYLKYILSNPIGVQKLILFCSLNNSI